MVTVAKSIDVFLDLLSLDFGPEFATRQHCRFHLEDLPTRHIVAPHEVLKGEDSEDQGRVL